MKNAQGRSTANLIVTAHMPDGTIKVRHWRGKSHASIVRAARKKYGAKKIETGNVWYTHSYGAH